jgi:hypothetical protein
MIKHFKNPKDATHLMHLHPMVVLIMVDMILFVSSNGYTPMITSVIRTPDQNKRVGSTSDVHTTGRGVDLRCKDWSEDFKKEFKTYFENKYKGHGATGHDGKEKLVVIHGEGENIHCHIQVARVYGDPMVWMKI